VPHGWALGERMMPQGAAVGETWGAALTAGCAEDGVGMMRVAGVSGRGREGASRHAANDGWRVASCQGC